ncbi:hypothetical protein CMU99_16300 [Elizabethkingia anophelis]|nr:hypothetical protein [Elizabethkingia anophelis]
MKIKHNGKTYNIPASLAEITLKQVIDFQAVYGNEIEEFYKSQDKEDELADFELKIDMACKSVSFFSGIPLEEIYKTNLDNVLSIYMNVLSPLFEPQEKRDFQDTYYFEDALWDIINPELSFNNSMSFNELILGKEITNDLQKFSIGRYDALLRLCVIYFRKKDAYDNLEKFDESWLQEDSDRMQLMNNLPMDIALDVAFFLLRSMHFYMRHSQCLEKARSQAKDQI